MSHGETPLRLSCSVPEVVKGLDNKDRQILFLLSKNCRLTDSKIGKLTRMSKQAVGYRIRKLAREGILTKFVTIIDPEMFGYTFYNVYLELDSRSKERDSKLLEKFLAEKSTTWIVEGFGKWDYIVCVLAKDVREFHNILTNIFHICGDSLLDHATFTVVEAHAYPYKFLFQDLKLDYTPSYLGRKTDRMRLDRDDMKILQYISNDARARIMDVAAKTDLDPKKVAYRIKTMQQMGYIAAFTIQMDVSKLGYGWHYVFFKLKYANESNEKEFLKYIKSLPWVFYVIKGVGNYNLTLELHARDLEHYHQIISDIKERYKDLIKKMWAFQILKEHKCDFFPANIMEEMKDGK